MDTARIAALLEPFLEQSLPSSQLDQITPLARPAKNQQSIRVIREEVDRIEWALKGVPQPAFPFDVDAMHNNRHAEAVWPGPGGEKDIRPKRKTKSSCPYHDRCFILKVSAKRGWLSLSINFLIN